MPTKVYLAFDERMALHKPLPCALPNSYPDEGSVDDQNVTPVENPHRIIAIYNKLMHLETHEDGSRCFMEIPCVPIDRETVQLTHSKEHYDKLLSTMYMSDEELRAMTVPGDLYFCRDTFMAARLACGGVVECVNAVTAPHRRSTRAMAIVRPPGHHACYDEAMGFCYLNNVAVAAKYAVHTGRADRVLILDWDIHHGNGIQDLTYDNPDIFYLSIHRASFGSKKKDSWFYPGTGRPREVGVGDGAGTNLNICWGKGGMGNAEYARAFHDIVLPLLLTFKPALIIVACGLDAAKGDLLGDCGLTSDMFYTMTRCILEAAPETPIVTALEGGYNLEMSAECMETVALALLDEPLHKEDISTNYYWTSSSILPQRPKVKTNEMATLTEYWKDKDVSKSATNAIKCTCNALARKGGTCLGGTHFLCHHSECLPMKKRKMINRVVELKK